MFNLLRVKKLEKELETEKAQMKSLQERFNHILTEQRQTNSLIEKISNKVEPKPIPKYDVPIVEFAKKLQRFQRKQQCGGGRACQQYYMIPCSEIDALAKAVRTG